MPEPLPEPVPEPLPEPVPEPEPEQYSLYGYKFEPEDDQICRDGFL